MRVKGVLLSEENNQLTTNLIKNENIEFIIVRAGYTSYSTYKNKFEDKNFDYNLNKALDFNLPIGIYYESCATSYEEAIEEANYFINILDKRYYDYPLYVHINDNHNTIIYSNVSQEKLSKEDLIKIVLAFCSVVDNSDYKIGIISSLDWFNNKLNNNKLNNYDRLIKIIDNNHIYVYKNIKRFSFDNDNNIQIVLEENCLNNKIINYLKMICKLVKYKVITIIKLFRRK